MKANRTSKTGMMHPYLKPEFLMKPENQWWLNPIYPQSVADRMERILQSLVSSERNNSKI